VLRFDLDFDAVGLGDVRISIMPFIFATLTTSHRCNILVFLKCPSSTSSWWFTLEELRHTVLDQISPQYWERLDPNDLHSKNYKRDGRADTERYSRTCPEIINSYGEIIPLDTKPASETTYQTWLDAHALYGSPEEQDVVGNWCYELAEAPFPFDGRTGSV
jgi:hypothetical protein